jgi:hypothetical protein
LPRSKAQNLAVLEGANATVQAATRRPNLQQTQQISQQRKDIEVKLLAQRQLRARAWPFADNPQLVRLRIGTIDYVTAVEQSAAMSDAADGPQ